MYLTRRDKDAAVRAHPRYLYTYAPAPRDVRYVFNGMGQTVVMKGVDRAYRWILDFDSQMQCLDYEKNKAMDLEFGTDLNSPLHSRQRFPTEWAADPDNATRR